MKNRIVGIIIICIAALMGAVIWVFNRALTEIVNTACEHGPTCPMWGSISFHTSTALMITAFVVLIGLYLIFFGKEKMIVTKVKKIKEQLEGKKITKEHYQKILSGLGSDERSVLEAVLDSKGAVFQSELVNKTGFTKVKVTRIIDRLEGKGLVERKRRGMTNVVVLKH